MRNLRTSSDYQRLSLCDYQRLSLCDYEKL
nr:MAG TPA: hypothetical protein [Caudoviricetes sp.]